MNSVEPSSPNSTVGRAVAGGEQAEVLAFGREDRDAAGHGCEHVAVAVDRHAVARAFGVLGEFAGVEEHAAFAERAVLLDRKRHDDGPLGRANWPRRAFFHPAKARCRSAAPAPW